MRNNYCVTCGMPCYSKKLRSSEDGGFEIYCRECMIEARAEYEYEKSKDGKKE